MNNRDGSESDEEDDGDAGDVEGGDNITFSGPSPRGHFH